MTPEPATAPPAAVSSPPGALAIVRASASTSVVGGFFFGFMAVSCLLVPFLPMAARRVFEAHLATALPAARPQRSGRSYALVLAAYVGYVLAAFAGRSVVDALHAGTSVVDRFAGEGASAPALAAGVLVATLGLALALRGFVFLPFVLADGRLALRFGEGVALAADLAGRAGRRFWVVFHAIFLPPFLGAPLLLFVDEGFGAGVSGVAWGVGLVAASAWTAARYAALTVAGVEALPEAAGRTPRALRVFGWSAPVAGALALVATLAALAVPTEAERVRRSPTSLSDFLAELGTEVAIVPLGEHVRLPGTSVDVWATRAAVYVEAADGGGAGAVALDGRGGAPTRFGVAERPDGRFALVVTQPLSTDFHALLVDSEGVRRDDGLARRAGERLGQLGMTALAVVLLAWLFFGLRSHRRIAEARTLHAVRSARDLEAYAGERLALDGVLQTDSLVLEGRLARFPAGASVMGSGVRVPLPPELPILGEGELEAGAHVGLIGRFRRLGAAGLRDTGLPCPPDAALVPGGREEAVRVLLERAAREGAGALAVALLGSLFVTIYVALSF